MTRYNLIVWDHIPQGEGQKDKTIPRTVGNGKTNENGNIELFITKGVAVSGHVTLSPWKAKDEESEE
jgi:hypothetical protein